MQESRTVLAIISEPQERKHSVTGEPVAMKVARRVRGGGVEKGQSLYLVGVLLYHFAHEKREDGCHCPAHVLGEQKGTVYPESVLNRILFATCYTRHLNRFGYLRVQGWKLYGEAGLSGSPVTVWVYDGSITVEYQAVTLSKYHIELEEDRKQIKHMSNPRLAKTPFHSPQLTLLDVGPDEWRLYWRVPSYQPRRRLHHIEGMVQLPLFELSPEEKAVGAEGTSQGQQARPRLHLVSRENPS